MLSVLDHNASNSAATSTPQRGTLAGTLGQFVCLLTSRPDRPFAALGSARAAEMANSSADIHDAAETLAFSPGGLPARHPVEGVAEPELRR